MELERISAVVRPRVPWEAIDLGMLLVRSQYARMVATSLLLLGPVVLGMALLLPDRPGLVLFLCWWTKPAWERLHLHHLSHSLFGETPGVADTLRAFPRFVRPGLLGALTVRRLSPLRSFDLPVSMLEDLRGPQWRRRAAVLRRGPSVGVATWLTLILAHVETFLVFGAFGLAFALVPETVDLPWWDWLLGDGEGLAAWVRTGIGVSTFLLTAPFYVGGGFALYLNRRTRLEAWDLEIAFRRAAERLSRRRAAFAVAGAGLVLLASPVLDSGAWAGGLDRESARAEIEEVLAGDEFHTLDTVSLPRFVLDWSLDRDDPEAWTFPEWLTGALSWLFAGLAETGRVLVIALALALLAWFLFRYRSSLARWRPAVAGGFGDEGEVPTMLFGLPVTEESLPVDVPARAHALWVGGRQREALALLYRASLARLIARHRVPLLESSTELECIELAAPFISAREHDFLRRLTGVWQSLAYAHEAPAGDRFQELSAGFVSHFERQSTDLEEAPSGH